MGGRAIRSLGLGTKMAISQKQPDVRRQRAGLSRTAGFLACRIGTLTCALLVCVMCPSMARDSWARLPCFGDSIAVTICDRSHIVNFGRAMHAVCIC